MKPEEKERLEKEGIEAKAVEGIPHPLPGIPDEIKNHLDTCDPMNQSEVQNRQFLIVCRKCKVITDVVVMFNPKKYWMGIHCNGCGNESQY